MSNSVLKDFQNNISNVLVRHKSILDIISKYQESCAQVNRSIIKAATDCGCIHIDAKKQDLPDDISYEDLITFMSTHVTGDLCDICKDKVEEKLGKNLFYLISICNTLNLDLHDVLEKESKNISTLGKYTLY